MVLFSNSDLEDVWFWPASKFGIYTVTSGYKLRQIVDGSAVVSKSWAVIWHLPIQERIRCFLLQVKRDVILCNANRRRRHLASDGMCDVCGAVEIELHVLRDCVKAKRVWERFGVCILACNQGHCKVIMELDSSSVIHLLQSQIGRHHPLGWLIKHCQDIRDRDWEVRFIHVYREGNRAVDW